MLKGFITNLEKYNGGELCGKWVEFPVYDEDEQAEILTNIGIGGNCEEYFFTAYECDEVPNICGQLDEYTTFDELNDIADQLETLFYSSQYEIVDTLISEGGYDIEEAVRVVDDCIIFTDCYDMADVAEHYYYVTGLIEDIPENIVNYIDWDAVGRDMEIEGEFYELNESPGYVEVIR